jgi:predicted transcriptional regulator
MMGAAAIATFDIVTKIETIRAALGLKIGVYDLKVLIAITTLVNQKNGLAFPPRSTISNITGIDGRHVSRSVQRLCELGLIEIAKRGDARKSARYRVVAAEICNQSSALAGTTAVPPEDWKMRLYGNVIRASRGASAVPPEVPEVVISPTEAQAKVGLITNSKIAAVPVTTPPPLGAAAVSSPATEALQKTDQPMPRNSWRSRGDA